MSSDNCYNITYRDFNAAKVVTGVLNSLVCLMCIVAAALIIFLKAHKRLVPRLMLILVVVAFLYMVVDALDLLSISYEGPHNDTGFITIRSGKGALTWCIINAWVCQFFLLMIVLLLCWIAIHLCLSLHGQSCCIKEWKVHMIILAIALLLSAFPLIPLCPGKAMAYGMSGIECEFKERDYKCNLSECMIAIDVSVFYIPFVLVFVLILAMTGHMLLNLCLKAQNGGKLRPSSQVQIKRALEGTLVPAAILLVGTILLLMAFLAHLIIIYRQDSVNFSTKGEWVWYAAVEPILFALIPVSIFIQPGTLKKLRWSELKLAAWKWIEKEDHCETEFIVTGDLESSGEVERLIIRGSPTSSNKGFSTYGINED